VCWLFLAVVVENLGFACRVSEINRKRELDVQLQMKEKEIRVAEGIAKETGLAKWLKTGCSPPLMWLPRLHNQDTRLLLEQRLVDVGAWEVRPSTTPLVLPRLPLVLTRLGGDCAVARRCDAMWGAR